MSDIDVLQQRIEQAELRLRTAHTARQRESAALTSMWAQIRDRFAAQSAEIVRLRGDVAQLQDVREQLSGMVLTLLGSIETSIDRMADETVPHITGLADSLLKADAADRTVFAADPTGDLAVRPAEDTRLPVAPAPTAPPAESDDFLSILAEHLDDVDVPAPPPPPEQAIERVTAAPMSAGIRDLIARIEGAFEQKVDNEEAAAPAFHDPAEEKDQELARDLNDIRRLRDELQNLRARIGTGR